MATPKPNISIAWAQNGTVTVPGDPKIDQGWGVEKPPYQYFNFIDNRQDLFLKHVNENGIPVWDAITTYDAGAIVKGGNDEIYRSLQSSNQNNNPTLSPAFWIQMFDTPGVVKFSAFPNGTPQVFPFSISTKVSFGGISLDTNSNYDIALSRFTPTISGFYYFKCSVNFPIIGSPDGNMALYLNKNGVIQSYDVAEHIGTLANGITATVSASFEMNGSTDYVDAYLVSGINTPMTIQNNYSFFQGYKTS